MAAVCLAFVSTAWAVNSVVVETKDQLAPNSTVDVRVKFTNDVEVKTITCPLVIRADSVDGSGALTAPVSAKVGWRDRLPRFGGPISEIVAVNSYPTEAATGAGAGSCKQAQPGGFGAPICDQDTVIADSCIGTTPWAINLVRGVLFGARLSPGSDTVGSVSLEFELNDEEGCFIVDTTCTNPANHLVYVNGQDQPVAPSFTSGRVCVGIEACRYVGLTAPSLDSVIWDGVSNAIDFYWENLGDSAASYDLQLADSLDPDFTNPFYEVNVTDNHHQALFPGGVPDILNNYWRVRGVPSSPPVSLAAGAAQEYPACIGDWSEPLIYTDVKVISSSVVPESYSLEQNYPNPFNASTVINFTNRRDGHVKLEVFNILGQSVITLVDDYKPMGVYSVDWSGVDESGSAVPSGMYFYRFTAKNHAEVKKMTLLK